MVAPKEQSIDTLRHLIDACPPGGLVFFGGAGVSTESGIPDFRSEDGLYSQSYAYPPEKIISHSFFETNPEVFFHFYFDRMVASSAKSNAAHKKLAELEKRGICKAIITQNIDGLHQAAGSKYVLELHGSVHRNYCTHCHAFYTLGDMLGLHHLAKDGIPRCTACGEIIKPDVVLYEEPLDSNILDQTIEVISRANLLIVAGTSLVVYPAAGLIQAFQGDTLAIINLSPTYADAQADLCITAKVGEVFASL